MSLDNYIIFLRSKMIWYDICHIITSLNTLVDVVIDFSLRHIWNLTDTIQFYHVVINKGKQIISTTKRIDF